MAEKLGVGHILPLEVMDKCIGRKIQIIMKDPREFYGTLQGFDEFMNMQLDDCKEYTMTNNSERKLITPTPLASVLINGSHVCMMVPGDNPSLN